MIFMRRNKKTPFSSLLHTAWDKNVKGIQETGYFRIDLHIIQLSICCKEGGRDNIPKGVCQRCNWVHDHLDEFDIKQEPLIRELEIKTGCF